MYLIFPVIVIVLSTMLQSQSFIPQQHHMLVTVFVSNTLSGF